MMTRTGSRRRIVCLGAGLGAILCAAAASDPVVAERGGDHVTVGQARAMIQAAPPDLRRRLTTDPAALKEFLRNVLIERAVLAEAQAAHWDQRPDVAALLARTHDEVLAQSYLASHAEAPPAYPTEAEIQTAYAQNKAQFMQPRAYHIVQLYVPKPGPGSTDDGRARLAAMRTQIEHGRFAIADAPRHSGGGGVQYVDLGWTSEKQLVPQVKDAVVGLVEGGLAGPVCTENGCHLLKLLATRPAGPAPLLEVREGLIRAMRQQKQAEGERAYASAMLAKQPVAVNEIELSKIAP